MPCGLQRYYGSGDLHFITCSCYRRKQFLLHGRRDELLRIFEETRQDYLFTVVGYVVMPEHFHLLISEPVIGDPSTVMLTLKRRTAQRFLAAMRDAAPQSVFTHFWQRRFYDFNVYTARKEREKLLYMHHNPVKRGLVKLPEDWPWSSYGYYAFGEKGPVQILVGPPSPKEGEDGAPVR